MRVTAETKLQTDRAIRDAARRLFAGKGFDATSTREIAKEAGIAIGTLFNYYPTKEDLALDLIDEALEIGHAAYARRIETLPPTTLEEDLFALIAAGLRALASARSSVAQVLEAGLSPFSVAEAGTSAARIRSRHLERVASSLARYGLGNLATPVTMHLYWSLYLGILSYWAADESPRQQDSLALIDQSVRMFVEALRPRSASSPSATEVPS